MLAETSRILEKGGKAHFWSVVVGGIEAFVSLSEIRALVKRARTESSTKEEKEYLSGFGLEICENDDPSWQSASRELNILLSHAPMRNKTLVLTRKVA